MGTHKSRHNKGRKPLYKEHGIDSARNFVERIERIANDETVPLKRSSRPSPNVDLEASVAKYLNELKAKAIQARSDEEARLAAARKPMVQEIAHEPDLFKIDEQSLISISDRDIPLQLYMEKSITVNQLRSARLWQHYLEECSLQPCVSIDPGQRLTKQCWQRDGDMSDEQYLAMIIRKMIAGPMGNGRVRFLDTILQPDVTRAAAIRSFRLRWSKIKYELLWCLDALSIYFGQESGFPGDGMDLFREAANKRIDFRAAWAKEAFGEIYSSEGHERTLEFLGAIAHMEAANG